MEIVKKATYYFASDFDGTAFDDVKENYNRAQEVWQEKFNSELPVSFEQFVLMRPYLKRIENYFSGILAFEDSYEITDGYKRSNTMPVDIPEKMKTYKPEIALECKDLFYRLRNEKININKQRWLAEQKPYEGFVDMVKDLKDMDISFGFISSKDEKSIRELCEEYEIEPDFVHGKNYGENRKEQLERFACEKEKARIFTYDDVLQLVKVANDSGMNGVFALQGYETEKNKSIATKDGNIIVAYPQQVSGKIGNLLDK